jgi:hypothetical protein
VFGGVGNCGRNVCIDRAFRIRQLAGGTATDRASHCAKRATDQDTNRTCNHGTNGRTRSRTRHNTATDQGRLRFPLGLFGSEPNLGCGSRILGRHTMPGNSLLGKVWVNRLCARRLRSQ